MSVTMIRVHGGCCHGEAGAKPLGVGRRYVVIGDVEAFYVCVKFTLMSESW